MSTYAIGHDSYAISDSISTVLARQKSGTLIADDRLVENRIVKPYVDLKADTEIPNNAETATVVMSFFAGEISVRSQNNNYKREFYNFVPIVEDYDNAKTIVDYYYDPATYSIITPSGYKSVKTYPAVTIASPSFNRNYFVEFSGTFRQSASKASGKYHNAVLALEIADRNVYSGSGNTLASNYWPLITFKVDSTQEKNFSAHALFTPTVAAKKYRIRWFVEERGDTGNKFYYSNVNMNITKFD